MKTYPPDDHQTDGDRVTRFDSRETIRSFAGEDPGAAHLPPEARELLTRYDERVEHYEVAASEE